jgi:hypothetical protein
MMPLAQRWRKFFSRVLEEEGRDGVQVHLWLKFSIFNCIQCYCCTKVACNYWAARKIVWEEKFNPQVTANWPWNIYAFQKRNLLGHFVFLHFNHFVLYIEYGCRLWLLLPVEDLARPTPSCLLAAQTTWVKCPAHIQTARNMGVKNF